MIELSETRVRIVKACIVGMMSVSIFQALTIRKLTKDLEIGRKQFNKLHEASNYILNVIEENDIELTDFDVIAITNLIEGTDTRIVTE